MAIVGQDHLDTRNWGDQPAVQVGRAMQTRWVDLDNVDSDNNDLRLRGYDKGAARFARGEGLCYAQGSIDCTCTIGGPDRMGQVFEYQIGPFEGTSAETNNPGQLRLAVESKSDSLLHHADNICMSPWGDLVICEDTGGNCSLIGVKADGSAYMLADNPFQRSELAGLCFSPDGHTMFLNIQKRGLTLAVNGPW
jgi:secreted PhoX family phosphatase